MRALLILISTVAMAQAPAPKAAAPAKPAAAAPAKPVAGAPKPAPAKPVAPAAPVLTTDDQKTIYALGASIYESLLPFYLSPAELEIVKRALSDGARSKPAIDVAPWQPKIQSLAFTREKAKSAAYLAKAILQPDATKTESGLIYREVTPGTGASPKATDMVKVNYRGTFVNGKEFDSSYKRNEPAEFPLNGVIRCWTEGVQLMKVGGKSVLVCPSDIAYGDAGRSSIPGGATLIFEIELLSIGGANQ